MAGRRIVEMVREDLRMSKILTRPAFENAIRVNAAIGGSTNAIVHLLAIAGRMGVKLDARGFRPARPRHALAGRSAAVGPLPDGGFLLCRRLAGGDRRAGRASSSRRAHRDRQEHGREQCGRAMLESRGDPRARQSLAEACRHRRVARQSLSRRRGDQALGGDASLAQASRPRGRVRERSRISRRASTIRRSISTRAA